MGFVVAINADVEDERDIAAKLETVVRHFLGFEFAEGEIDKPFCNVVVIEESAANHLFAVDDET